ncbi:hypothetical protein ACFY1U_30220 [Streptomyces sp. NPDC001351]|uniref:hypothetical protein n=1 Tax=Streptomyces sp. NPDC001351 TaxID=3364564 RepID=UPI00368BE6ED
MLVSAAHRFAGQQGDHLLITAANEDNPGGGKHITLQPGAKACGAVNLFDYGSKHHTVQSLAIAQRGAHGQDGPFCSVVMKGPEAAVQLERGRRAELEHQKPYDF